jgi:hypothetical protein
LEIEGIVQYKIIHTYGTARNIRLNKVIVNRCTSVNVLMTYPSAITSNIDDTRFLKEIILMPDADEVYFPQQPKGAESKCN